MSDIKVTVGNGEVGIGSRIAWISKRGGVRTGVIDKITIRERWGRQRVTVRARPDNNPKFDNWPQSLYRLKNIVSLNQDFPKAA